MCHWKVIFIYGCGVFAFEIDEANSRPNYMSLNNLECMLSELFLIDVTISFDIMGVTSV